MTTKKQPELSLEDEIRALLERTPSLPPREVLLARLRKNMGLGSPPSPKYHNGVRKPHGFWKQKLNVQSELDRVAKKLGHFPSWIDLEHEEEWSIIQGIRNYHGGKITSFREAMGHEPKYETKPENYWPVWKNMKRELEGVIQQLDHFPSGTELKSLGRSDILNGVSYHGGILQIRIKMGYGQRNQAEVARENKIRELEKMLDEPLEDFIQREYVDGHRPLAAVAEEVGCAERTMHNLAQHYGIKIRTTSETKLPKGVKKPSKQRLRELYVTQRKSTIEMEKDLGVSHFTISRWLTAAGIPLRDISERARKEGSRKPTQDELKIEYVDRHKSQNELGEQYGVSSPTIGKWLDQYDISRRRLSAAHLPADFKEPSREQLITWYVDQEKSAEDIADLLGVSKGKVLHLMRNNDIERRTKTSRTDSIRPSKKELERLYITERQIPIAIGRTLGVTGTTVRRWLEEYHIHMRNHAEARMSSESYRPSNDQLREWYVTERKTTVEIAEMAHVSDPTVGTWLRETGITLRDKRGIYDDKSRRLGDFKELLGRCEKTPRTISTSDFCDTKRIDGTSYSGLLGWYRRNHQADHGTARDMLLQDLVGLPLGMSIHSNRKERVSITELEHWDGFKATIMHMFSEHPELQGQFPSTTWLCDHGYSHIMRASSLHGGINKVREQLGQNSLRRSLGYWRDFAHVETALRDIIESHKELGGNIPSVFWLDSQGYSCVSNAISKYHGGIRAVKERVHSLWNLPSEKDKLETLLKRYVGET